MPRERWMRPPVMTAEEVDSWIANRKSFYSSTYDDLLMGRSRARVDLSDPRVPVKYRAEAIKNHDLITARIEELSYEEDPPSTEPRINSKIMTKTEVDSWIATAKSILPRTYDEMLMGRDGIRAELADPRRPVDYRVEQLKNHDLVTARLEELSHNEKIGKVINDKARGIATRDAYEKRTGQTGDPKLSPVGKILGYAGIKSAGKKRTLKKRKQKKRTVKRKH